MQFYEPAFTVGHPASRITSSELPEADELLDEGRRLAPTVTIGPCPFLGTYEVQSESEYKRRRMAVGRAIYLWRNQVGGWQWPIAVVAVGLLLARLSYLGAVAQARGYGQQIRASIDL
jgi:hypothetical protein